MQIKYRNKTILRTSIRALAGDWDLRVGNWGLKDEVHVGVEN
jgi:hypothetical protein